MAALALSQRLEREGWGDHFLDIHPGRFRGGQVVLPEGGAATAHEARHGAFSCAQEACAEAKLPLSRAEVRSHVVSAAALGGLLKRLHDSSGMFFWADEAAGRLATRTVVLPIDQGEELFTPAAAGGLAGR